MNRFIGKVFNGDALDLLRAIPTASVDAVIADAMYGTAKIFAYDWGPEPARGDPTLHWLYHEPIYEECLRVLKPGGVLAWGQGSRFLGIMEDWFGPHRVWPLVRWAPHGIVAGPHIWVVQTRERQPVELPRRDLVVTVDRPAYLPLRKLHPCPKPVEEMEFLVEALTRPGEIVLDCFCGLGSTLVAAQRLGRRWVGGDKSRRYCQVAMKRLDEVGRRERSGAEASDTTPGGADAPTRAGGHPPGRGGGTAIADTPNLFSKGSNSKLGGNVFVFNLPVRATCPGMTPACSSVCYADKGHYRWPHLRTRFDGNLEAARAGDFVARAVAELRGRKARLLRIHSSGDFYDAAYVRAWEDILTQVPDLEAWAYTRSWRVPELLVGLTALAKLPNFRLWFSADRDTGMPPEVEGVRVCLLRDGDEPFPDPEGRVDLVFPTRRKGRSPAKRLALPLAPEPALICPAYQGTAATAHVTCEECRLCLPEGSTPR